MSEEAETSTIKTDAIKKKINAFFIEQAFDRRINFSVLQVFVDVKNETELNFYLCDDKKLNESVSLEKILNLNFAEKLFVKEDEVMATLYKAINNFAVELQVKKEVLQILIKSSNEYFICIDKHIDHKITINQIIS